MLQVSVGSLTLFRSFSAPPADVPNETTKVPTSYLKKQLGRELKCLQENAKSPVAFNFSLFFEYAERLAHTKVADLDVTFPLNVHCMS